MNPMSVEEAEAKKAFLSKLYFGISLATFCTVLYQVKQGRLLWLESEGLIPEDEVKLSPGKCIIFSSTVYNENTFFGLSLSLSICQDVGC